MKFIKSTFHKIIVKIADFVFGNAWEKSMEQYNWAKENLLMTKLTQVSNNMTEKTIKIPLTNNRNITMKFCKFDDNQWKCVMSDECLTDIVTFFNNGYYKMDTENKIQVKVND